MLNLVVIVITGANLTDSVMPSVQLQRRFEKFFIFWPMLLMTIRLLVLNVGLICSALLIVKVIFVITVFFLFLLCVSTILVNKDDQSVRNFGTR